MDNKHLRPDESPVDLPDDLEENPGIGQSKGLFARAGAKDSGLLEGENTVEGDLENDATMTDGVRTEPGRTNE